MGAGFFVVGTVQNDFGAEVAGGGDFYERGHHGHHDDGADAALGGVVGDGLSVISGGGGDESAAAFGWGEGEDAVECAALFECSGALQVIELEVDLLAGEVGDFLGFLAGRAVDEVLDALLRVFDFEEGHCCRHCFAFVHGDFASVAAFFKYYAR